MEIFFEKIASLPGKLRAFDILEIFHSSKKRTLLLLEQIKNIGVEESMDEYEKKKTYHIQPIEFFSIAHWNSGSYHWLNTFRSTAFFSMADCLSSILYQYHGIIIQLPAQI